MVRRVLSVVAALALIASLTVRPAAAQVPASGAWILVDADTGAVLGSHADHAPMRVASVFKLLTALVAVDHLTPDQQIPVSPHAEGMPARKINLKAGQSWAFRDLLASMLMVSANDAAVAVAEQIGGSLEGFEIVLEGAAARLGLGDTPQLKDPAGLDDEFSHEGGNLVSARDLAIITRTAMRHPAIAELAALPEYRFSGGDGHPHRLLNGNRLLRTYAGATGMKTGATKRAGRSIVATAHRDGRTMLAVVIRGDDIYTTAAALLDRGFSIPVAAQQGLDQLPPIATTVPAPGAERAAAAAVRPIPPRPEGAPAPQGRGPGTAIVLLGAGGTPATAVLLLRRRAVRRQRQRRLARAALSPR